MRVVGSTDSDQSPSGAGPAPSLVELESASLSRMGISILVVLVSLIVASADTASFASSPAVPPAAVLVEDRCPGCGVGHLQTIWQAGRPGQVERQRIPILDSFMTRMHPKPISLFYHHPLRLGPAPHAPRQGIGSRLVHPPAYRHDRINSR